MKHQEHWRYSSNKMKKRISLTLHASIQSQNKFAAGTRSHLKGLLFAMKNPEVYGAQEGNTKQ